MYVLACFPTRTIFTVWKVWKSSYSQISYNISLNHCQYGRSTSPFAMTCSTSIGLNFLVCQSSHRIIRSRSEWSFQLSFSSLVSDVPFFGRLCCLFMTHLLTTYVLRVRVLFCCLRTYRWHCRLSHILSPPSKQHSLEHLDPHTAALLLFTVFALGQTLWQCILTGHFNCPFQV